MIATSYCLVIEISPERPVDPSPRPLPQGERGLLCAADRDGADPLRAERGEKSPSPPAGEGRGEGSLRSQRSSSLDHPVLEVLQHLARSVGAGGAHDAAAGVSTGAAHVEAVEGTAILA